MKGTATVFAHCDQDWYKKTFNGKNFVSINTSDTSLLYSLSSTFFLYVMYCFNHQYTKDTNID